MKFWTITWPTYEIVTFTDAILLLIQNGGFFFATYLLRMHQMGLGLQTIGLLVLPDKGTGHKTPKANTGNQGLLVTTQPGAMS